MQISSETQKGKTMLAEDEEKLLHLDRKNSAQAKLVKKLCTNQEQLEQQLQACKHREQQDQALQVQKLEEIKALERKRTARKGNHFE